MKWMPSTKSWYWLYLFAIHLALGCMAYYLLREQLYFFIVLEFLLLLSFLVGLRFYSIFLAPFRLLNIGQAALIDGDFSIHLRPGGSPELNQLIGLYNQMLTQLRRERSSKQEKQYFLEKLLHAAPLGVISLDFDGHIHLLNPAMQELLKLPAIPAAATPLSTIAHPLAAALQTVEADTSQLLSIQGQGRYQVERGTFIDRGFQKHFILVQDMSQQLLETEKQAYGQVIRMMAHEVNNSIGATNSLLGSLLEVVAEKPTDFPSLATEYLPIVMDRGNQMSRFMRHFADVIRLPSPHFQPTDLGDLLQGVATLFAARCQAAKVELQRSLPEAPVIVNIDRSQIEQVLINALTNALESIGERGGIIRLCLDAHSGNIRIQDNGPGIPPELASQLFTPFFSTKANGQGIGLTLSRDILAQHAATYHLKTLDEWTEFYISWP